MMDKETADAYLAAITATFGAERPKRWKPALKILKRYLHPDAVIAPKEFAEVFESEYELAGCPLLSSSQFTFYIAAYMNSNWLTGRISGQVGAIDAPEDAEPVLDMTYTDLMHAADGAKVQGQEFDLAILQGSIAAKEYQLPASWSWYLADITDIDPVVLACRIGCTLPTITAAQLGKDRKAPPPGDLYILEEMEVPYDYYEALTPYLHISDIVRSYVQDIPLEYALAMHQ